LIRKSDIFKHGFGLNVKWPRVVPPLKSLHEQTFTPDIPAELKYAYCNYGFSLLGYLIEVFSGMDFRDYMQKNILEPLGMIHSDFNRTPLVQTHEVQGYVLKRGKLQHATYWQSIIKPAGGLYSNVEDMQKFGAMLLNIGTYNNHQILQPETLKLCWTPQFAAHPSFTEYNSIGLGFQIFALDHNRIIEHNGITSGFTSCFSLIPEKHLGMVVFGNLDEIFRTDKTLTIKNLLLQNLCHYSLDEKDSNLSFSQEKQPQDLSLLKKFTGYYGPWPGVLTNTRVFQGGGDFKISLKNQQLKFSSLYGPLRSGKLLTPTLDPYVFTYLAKIGSTIDPVRKIAFQIVNSEKKENVQMAMGFLKLRKNILIHTFRAKIYCILLFLITILLILFIFAL
jgi:hypothetical protein